MFAIAYSPALFGLTEISSTMPTLVLVLSVCLGETRHVMFAVSSIAGARRGKSLSEVSNKEGAKLFFEAQTPTAMFALTSSSLRVDNL